MPTSFSKTRSNKPFKTLLYRLLGYTSLGVALITMILYWYRHHRRQKSLPPTVREHSPTTVLDETAMVPVTPQDTFTSRLISNVLSRSLPTRRKRILTISMKNTILWNPSPDPGSPNHAFYENSIPLLQRLATHYHIYLIIHTAPPSNPAEQTERSQIQDILQKTKLFDAKTAGSTALDSRKVLYCSTEEGKVHIVRHLEPAAHVEGGYHTLEDDDGADIVKKVSSFVNRVIWCRRRRRISQGVVKAAKEEMTEEWVAGRKGIEICGRLVESSLAKEVGLV